MHCCVPGRRAPSAARRRTIARPSLKAERFAPAVAHRAAIIEQDDVVRLAAAEGP